MYALRIPIAVLIGGLFTTSMFWLLWTLIGTAFDVGDRAEARQAVRPVPVEDGLVEGRRIHFDIRADGEVFDARM